MTLINAIQASESLLVQLANPAARALALAAAAGLGLVAFRIKDASARLFTWRTVLYAALAMPVLGWMLPPLAIPTPAFLRHEVKPKINHVQAAPIASSHSDSEVFVTMSEAGKKSSIKITSRSVTRTAVMAATAATAVSSGSVDTQISMDIPDAGPVPTSASKSPWWSSIPWSVLPWSTVGTALYFAGALILLVRFFVGIAFGGRLLRASHNIDDARLARQLSRQVGIANLGVAPQVAESEFISVPVTMGALRSTILLPMNWREWDDAKLEAVIAHEVSHVSRRDGLTQRLSLLHRAIFWFSPLAWWLDRRLADLAEQASDEAALSSGADRNVYARTLLGFFEALHATPGRVWWQGVAMAKAGQAERQAEERLERILAWKGSVAMSFMNTNFKKSAFKKSIAVAVAVLALPVLYLAAAVRPAGFTAGPVLQHVHFQGAQEQTSQESAPAAPRAISMPEPSAPPAAEMAPSPDSAPSAELAPSADSAAQAEPAPTAAIAGAVGTKVYGVPAAIAPVPSVPAIGVAPAIAPHRALIYPQGHPPIAALAPMAPMRPVPMVAWQNQSHGSGSSYSSGKGQKGSSYRYGYDDDQRFVIVTGNSDSLTMSGSGEDARHVEKLRKTIPGDFIWFERDEKPYVIRDQATIDRARAFWAPQEELGRKQEALGKQQEALGEQQEALGAKMEQVQVNVPDMTAELDKLKAKLQKLGPRATMEQIGDLQEEIGELQSKFGEVQSQAGDAQGKLGEEQGKLGEAQGKLGEEQGKLGEQQGKLAQEANIKMKALLDEAIRSGKAQPEL